MEKVAIFADVQNIYYTVKQSYRKHFNYAHFWKQVTNKREVIAAFAYAIDRGDQKQREFQQILRNIGFEVKLKPYIQRSDGSAKGDWDVGITLDVIEYAQQADIIVLLSGDGDFAILLDKIRHKQGTITEVYGVPDLTAPGLVKSADRFFAIEKEFLM